MLDPRETPEQLVDSLKHNEKLTLTEFPHGINSIDSEASPLTVMSPTPSPPPPGSLHRTGRWTPDEKILFLYGLKRFGKGRWKKMSIYLPFRSLVQIKSHAQKVLKRIEAGENVFRRLEENCNIIDSLIVQAAKQRDALSHCPPQPKSVTAKRKLGNKPAVVSPVPPTMMTGYSGITSSVESSPVDADVAALAASALCQLSSL
eukprot:Nitzschia sp. Nitz4//scaffold1_size375055//350823//351524//NITZ4_000339-RA/size375055-processed-gene-0.395-mRNA-1//1//CDS//3329541234//7536//frame0